MCNVFSSYFEIESADGKNEFHRSWSNNMETLNNDLKVTKCERTHKFSYDADTDYIINIYPVIDESKIKKLEEKILSNDELMEYRDKLTNQNNLASNKTRLATRSLGDGHFTTCTAVYYLPSGKGSYIIFFTFDGDSIEDAKVLCNKDNSESAYNNTGLSDKNFFVKEISQWKSVRPEEYKK